MGAAHLKCWARFPAAIGGQSPPYTSREKSRSPDRSYGFVFACSFSAFWSLPFVSPRRRRKRVSGCSTRWAAAALRDLMPSNASTPRPLRNGTPSLGRPTLDPLFSLYITCTAPQEGGANGSGPASLFELRRDVSGGGRNAECGMMNDEFRVGYSVTRLVGYAVSPLFVVRWLVCGWLLSPCAFDGEALGDRDSSLRPPSADSAQNDVGG